MSVSPFKPFVKVFSVLNTNSNPGQIAHAVCWSIILGFLPKTNTLWYILTILCLFMRINKNTFVLSTALISLVAPYLDPLFDTIGWYLLNISQLQNVYAILLDTPFIVFTKFNNTIVMGSLVAGIVLYVPVYFLVRLFVFLIRKYLTPLFRKTKVASIMTKVSTAKKIKDVM